MAREQSTDGDTRLRDDIRKSLEEDGIIKTAAMLVMLGWIAIIFFVPEGMRMIGCKITGSEYHGPIGRMHRDLDNIDE